jgi:protein-S-isoprenylcysteine O-methyltransferase Ste14
MTPSLPFTWPFLLAFWPPLIWVLAAERRVALRSARNAPLPAGDRGSFQVVLAGFGCAVLAGLLLPFVVPRAALPGSRVAWFFAGVATLVTGGLLRRHCFRVLGRFFTGVVTIQTGHRVVDSGAYRWVRHPSYSAAMLMVLGIALSAGNWAGVAVSLLVALPAYSYRANVEEQALLSALGAPYARFLSTRKRFIPFVY